MRKRQGKLDLVCGDVGVASAGQRGSKGSRANPEGSASDTERVHFVRRVVVEINGAVSTKTVGAVGVRFAAQRSLHQIQRLPPNRSTVMLGNMNTVTSPACLMSFLCNVMTSSND